MEDELKDPFIDDVVDEEVDADSILEDDLVEEDDAVPEWEEDTQ